MGRSVIVNFCLFSSCFLLVYALCRGNGDCVTGCAARIGPLGTLRQDGSDPFECLIEWIQIKQKQYKKRNQHPDPSKLFIPPIASRLTCRPFANNAESKRRSLEILSFISRCIFRRRYFLNVSSLLRNVGTGTPDAEVSIRATLAPQRVSDTPKFQIGYHLGKAKSLMKYRMP